MRGLLASACVCGIAQAQDALLSEPAFTVTETAVVRYHVDNRNDDRTDDHYGEWLNRLNLQVTSGRFTAAMRADSAVFFARPNPNELAEQEAEERTRNGQPAPPAFVQAQTQAFGTDLSDKYVNVVYPSKMWVRYKQKGVDVTVGDTYVQLGRGLVLSLRKIDELATDTTLRGVKAEYAPDLGALRLRALGVVGATNPVRVDEVSGRLLSQNPTGFERIVYPAVPRPNETYYAPNPEPAFAPDVIVGGQLEGGPTWAQLGVRGVQLTRSSAVFLDGRDSHQVRNAQKIWVGSGSLNLPSIEEHATFYAEVSGQKLADYAERADEALLDRLSGGYAVYVLTTAFYGPVTFSLEGKHYERFYPLSANVNRDALEFDQLQYSMPPTTEPITSDSQFNYFNLCVTGGRARLDARASKAVLLYGSVGRYRTWGEQSAYCGQEETAGPGGMVVAPQGRNDSIRNDVWDPVVGTELTWEHGRSHLFASSGVRMDSAAEPRNYAGVGQPTHVYYREQYVRYSLLKKIHDVWSAEVTGFHRYRFEPGRSARAWREGENYLSVIFAPRLTVAAGYEYSTESGDRKDYYNGLVQLRLSSDAVVRALAGQTRPALRCVSGVCRQYPAFEGVRLEASFTL